MKDPKALTVPEKIERLKKIHAGSHPDALAHVRQWESRFAQLAIEKDWLDHPCTAKLRDMVIEQIEMIVSVLSNQEKLSEDERRAIFEQKKAHLLYLALLTNDPGSEIKAIESQVDEEL